MVGHKKRINRFRAAGDHDRLTREAVERNSAGAEIAIEAADELSLNAVTDQHQRLANAPGADRFCVPLAAPPARVEARKMPGRLGGTGERLSGLVSAVYEPLMFS